MNKIELKDINFDKITKLTSQGSNAILYTDGNLCYKFFYDMSKKEKYIMENKLRKLSTIQSSDIIKPIDCIMEDGILKGYTMEYFDNSKSFANLVSNRYIDSKDFFNHVYKSSQILRHLHKNDFICHDLSFENILINQDGDIKFCDIDSCTYDKYSSLDVSLLLKRFIIDYRNSKLYSLEDVDKLSLIVSFLYALFLKEIQCVNKDDYNFLASKLNTLENMRKLASMLVDKNCPLYELPYLDELIDLKDDYVLDKTILIKRYI